MQRRPCRDRVAPGGPLSQACPSPVWLQAEGTLIPGLVWSHSPGRGRGAPKRLQRLAPPAGNVPLGQPAWRWRLSQPGQGPWQDRDPQGTASSLLLAGRTASATSPGDTEPAPAASQHSQHSHSCPTAPEWDTTRDGPGALRCPLCRPLCHPLSCRALSLVLSPELQVLALSLGLTPGPGGAGWVLGGSGRHARGAG